MFDSAPRSISSTTISRMRPLAQQSTSSSSQMWAAVAGTGRLLQQTMRG
jgi:hypothetical protein